MEDQFEALLAEKRHKELISAFLKQSEKMVELIEAIKSLPEPNVNVDMNQEEVVTSIDQLCSEILDSNNKVVNTLETRLLPDTFTLMRNNSGYTEYVKVNYKPANKIK